MIRKNLYPLSFDPVRDFNNRSRPIQTVQYDMVTLYGISGLFHTGIPSLLFWLI